MEIVAITKYAKSAPRKLSAVAKLVRRKNANEALIILRYTPKKAAAILAKTVKTAIYNAVNNFNLDKEDLTIKTIRIDQGPALVRFIAMARGSGNQYKKKMSHITVVLESPAESAPRKAPVKTIKKESTAGTTKDKADKSEQKEVGDKKTTATPKKEKAIKADKPKGSKTEVKVRSRKDK